MTGDGQFGAMVPRRTPDAITIALKHELATWANGGRDPSTIAEYWRPLLAPVAVASRIVDLINRQPRRT
jgi:hypothetical protein